METRALQLAADPEPLYDEGDVTMHWHVPASHPRRNSVGIVSLPIQGGDYDVSTHFARHFSQHGFHVLRFERRAEWLEATRPVADLARLAQQYRRDVTRGMDQWLAMDEVPVQRMGLMGVSMGAMMGAGVAATDSRIDSSVLCLGGGDMGDVLMRGRDEELDRYRTDLAAHLGVELPELRAMFEEAMGPIDSMRYAENISPEHTLFFGARFDRVVPWRNSVLLWEALGKPPRWTLPCGHYSAVVFVPLIRWLAVRHFDRTLTS